MMDRRAARSLRPGRLAELIAAADRLGDPDEVVLAVFGERGEHGLGLLAGSLPVGVNMDVGRRRRLKRWFVRSRAGTTAALLGQRTRSSQISR